MTNNGRRQRTNLKHGTKDNQQWTTAIQSSPSKTTTSDCCYSAVPSNVPASALEMVGLEMTRGVTPGALVMASRWTIPIRPAPMTPTLMSLASAFSTTILGTTEARWKDVCGPIKATADREAMATSRTAAVLKTFIIVLVVVVVVVAASRLQLCLRVQIFALVVLVVVVVVVVVRGRVAVVQCNSIQLHSTLLAVAITRTQTNTHTPHIFLSVRIKPTDQNGMSQPRQTMERRKQPERRQQHQSRSLVQTQRESDRQREGCGSV